jgi:hypothetical protein
MLVAFAVRDVQRVPLRRIALCSTVGLLGLTTAFTPPRAAEAFQTFSDEAASWRAMLDEDPLSPYRWEYSEWLRARGDVDGARREAIAYLKGTHVPPSRHLDFALALLADGDEDAAFDLLERLNGRLHPRKEGQVQALLSKRSPSRTPLPFQERASAMSADRAPAYAVAAAAV